MTGRRGRVVKTEKQPQPHYEARESDSSNVDSLNIQEVRILLEVKKKLQCQFNVFFLARKTYRGSSTGVLCSLGFPPSRSIFYKQ